MGVAAGGSFFDTGIGGGRQCGLIEVYVDDESSGVGVGGLFLGDSLEELLLVHLH